MPNPKDYKTKDDFMSACIPIVIKEGTAKDSNQAAAICNSMWDNKNKKDKEAASGIEVDGYKPFVFYDTNIGIGVISEGTIAMGETIDEVVSKDGKEIKYTVVDAVAAVGDRFYGNLFVPASVLKASADMWNSTYNDLSHLGTMYPAGMGAVENIEYMTGYNSDAVFDESINALRVKMHINHDAPKYKAWKNFVDNCHNAGRIPNVSIFGFYKSKQMRKSELPSGVHVPFGAANGQYIITMTDIVPAAITTCFKGKCDERAGCGISSGFSNNDVQLNQQCNSNNTCGCVDLEMDKKKLNYLKNRIKNIGK